MILHNASGGIRPMLMMWVPLILIIYTCAGALGQSGQLQHVRHSATSSATSPAGASIRQLDNNFELAETDFRFISQHDLLPSTVQFRDGNITAYAQMLFDVARNQVIVGARDILYRMSFDLTVLERSVWQASPSQIAMCQAKGQSESLCRNYVRVLQSYGENYLYACGTYAFNPNCSWRQMENLTVLGYDIGIGKCPFNPHSNITSLMASNGKMFVGTSTDFSSSDSAILRTDVKHNARQARLKIIRTKQYNNKWLNNPQFVGSFEAGNFVYFLFREVALEYSNCGKVIYSRIARVCKDDEGGDQILKDNWTTFLKARLNCSLPGEYPFYFNEIQGISYSADDDILYATFTTPDNPIYGSAVCAYNITAINAAFDGPFKFQEHSDTPWRSANSTHRSQFRCESPPPDNRNKYQLASYKYQLTDNAVQALTTTPLYYAKMERFTHIALDTTHTKTEKVNVLFLATTGNLVKKISVKHGDGRRTHTQSCLVEVWQLSEPAADTILTMEYLKVTNSLYVGSRQALLRVPAQHCGRHVSRTSCLNAMDPYCGWNELTDKCVPQEMDQDMNKYWSQADELQCPILTAPIDGAWSTWSEWVVCKQADSDADSNCMCRSRTCNNPQPQNGGRPCEGITTEVTNCTVHGEWTDWSAWSACSQSCGIAVQTRRRSCTNPKPAYGGRTCVGYDRTEQYCSHLPPCPAPKPQAIDGGWGPWGEWSECSADCRGGFRIRRRECNEPMPQNGGAECPGCATDYEICNTHECPEVKRVSQWTPWLVMPGSVTENATAAEKGSVEQHVERRFRFSCRANTADQHSVRITVAKDEKRVCHANGSCQRHGAADSVGAASGSEDLTAVGAAVASGDWGPCNVSCGGGLQYRLPHEARHSHGSRGSHPMQSRPCNMHPCSSAANEVTTAHEWGCWTDWSPCSVTCGVGLRRRTRKCLGGHDYLCHGRAMDEEKCTMTPCEDFIGWSPWSEWSECSADGTQFRHRKCLKVSPKTFECRGAEFEKTACVPDACGGVQFASTGVISSIIIFILITYSATIAITFWLTRRHVQQAAPMPKNNSASAQSYDAYPNQYSSLPTKDLYEVRPKVKRQSSFNMCSPTKNYANGNIGSGTLNRNNILPHNHTPKVLAKTYNDCETGTLKRNSHALNNYRANIDDEKF